MIGAVLVMLGVYGWQSARSEEAVSDMSAETQVEQDPVKRENECDEYS